MLGLGVTFLKNHVHTWAALKEASAHVVSCNLNLEKGEKGSRDALNDRVRLVRETSKENRRNDFGCALGRVEEFIGSGLLPGAKGTALSARAGTEPFFLPLQFEALLPNSLAVDSTPSTYHLVELKDTYHQYVVMLCGNLSPSTADESVGSMGQTCEKWLKEFLEEFRLNDITHHIPLVKDEAGPAVAHLASEREVALRRSISDTQ
ncbi:MAG: hypothetical protein O2857_24100 [Planctomycetota bacterium]|nr:hypothetical protein [Planctomycetota bacterium]